MPYTVSSFSASLGTKSNLPRPKKGIIGSAGTALFDALDAPGNIARGLIAFLRTTDPWYLKQAAATAVPGWNAERVTGEDVTGVDNAWLNFGVEIIADPLLFINQFGGLTKGGKALERINVLRKAKRAWEIKGRLDKAAEIAVDLEKATDEFKLLIGTKPIGQRGAQRSIMEVGLPFMRSNIQIGDYKKLRNALIRNVPIGFLPDSRKALWVKHATELERKIEDLEILKQANKLSPRKVKELDELTESLEAIQTRLSKGKFTIIPPRTAAYLRKLKKNIKTKFKYTEDSPMIRSLTEATEYEALEQEAKLGQLKLAMEEDFSTLRQLESLKHLSDLEIKTRLMQGMEFRGYLPPPRRRFGQEVLLDHAAYKASLKEDNLKKFESQRQRLKANYIKKLKKARTIEDPIKKAEAMQKVYARFDDAISGLKLNMMRSELELDKAVDTLGKLTYEELMFINKYTQHLRNMVPVEQGLRVPISTLKEGAVAYMHRLWTPEARAFKSKDKVKYSLIMKNINAKIGASIKRRLYPEKDIVSLNAYLRERWKIDFDWFDQDPIKSLIERKKQHFKILNRAATINAIVASYAQKGIKGIPVTTISRKTVGKRTVTTTGFLERLGLTGKAIGKLPAVDQSLRIPYDIATDVLKNDKLLTRSFFNENAVIRTFSTIDKINAPFRVLLTSLFPAFNNRNMVSNMYLNTLAGMNPIRGATFYSRALKHQLKDRLVNLGKAAWSPEELKFAEELRVYGISKKGAIYNELFEKTGATEDFLRKYTGGLLDVDEPITTAIKRVKEIVTRKPSKTVGETHPFLNPMTGRKWSLFVEDNARIALYMYAREAEKLTPWEATRKVKKYLFNYNELTQFEKQIMRPSFLFYTWMRKNIPLQLSSVLTDPRLISAYQKLTYLGEEEAPDYLRAGGAIPIPGKDVFLGSLGLPVEDLNITNVDDVDPMIFVQAKRLSQKLLSRMSPAIRIPAEILTGRIAHSNRPLEDISTLEFVKGAIPASRFFRTASKLIDPEEPMEFRLIDALTGIRTYPVSITRAQLDELKRAAVSTGKFKRSGFLTIAKEKFKEDPEVEAFQIKMRQLYNKMRKERK